MSEKQGKWEGAGLSKETEELRRSIFGSDIPMSWKASMLNDLKRVEQKKPGRNDPSMPMRKRKEI